MTSVPKKRAKIIKSVKTVVQKTQRNFTDRCTTTVPKTLVKALNIDQGTKLIWLYNSRSKTVTLKIDNSMVGKAKEEKEATNETKEATSDTTKEETNDTTKEETKKETIEIINDTIETNETTTI